MCKATDWRDYGQNEWICIVCGRMIRAENRPPNIGKCYVPGGLGDTVARVARRLHLDRVAKTYSRWTRRLCGCNSRQAWLNRIWPYRQPAPDPVHAPPPAPPPATHPVN